MKDEQQETQKPYWVDDEPKPEIKNNFLKKTAINFGIGLVLSFILMLLLGIFKAEPGYVTQKICDAFFVTGILFLCFGGLSYTVGEGVLIGTGYFLRNLLPGRKAMSYRDYYDSKMEKGEKKKRNILPLVAAGGIFIVLAIMFYYI